MNSETSLPAAEEWPFGVTAVHNQVHATLKTVNDHRLELSRRLMENGKEACRYKAGDKVLVDRRTSQSQRGPGPYRIGGSGHSRS